MTQKQAILNALKRGQKITPLEALRDFGCFRLAARIRDLKDDGYDIKKRMVEVEGRIAGRCVVAQYSLNNSGEQIGLF